MVSPTASQLPMVGTKVWGCPMTLLGALGSLGPRRIRTVFPRGIGTVFLSFGHTPHTFCLCVIGRRGTL